jgi:hypothetical protein
VNRAELRQLAEDRIEDARILLAAGRWSGAYYLAGYALECGLKACIMARVEKTGVIFQDKKVPEKCYIPDPEKLVELADLKPDLDAATATNATLSGNWGVATLTRANHFLPIILGESRSFVHNVRKAVSTDAWGRSRDVLHPKHEDEGN